MTNEQSPQSRPVDGHNCFERVYCAASGLCGDGPLAQRLEAALATLSALQAHEFPTEELQRLFGFINPYRNGVEGMNEAAQKELAKYVVNLLVGVAHLEPHTPETGADNSALYE